MAWRNDGAKRLPPGERKLNPLLPALVVVLLVLLLILPTRFGGGISIGLGFGYSLAEGTADYMEEEVVFTFICIAPANIDFDDLVAEIVLLSGGNVISSTTSNGSVPSEDLVIPNLRVFANVTVPHHGHEKEGLGFILTLSYKGRVGPQYVDNMIDWND